MDREKVIKGLECCQDGRDDECPYWTSQLGSASICRSEMERDALALLKAQEPVEPVFKANIETDLSYWQCCSCGAVIFGNTYKNAPTENRPRYCGCCGRAVKWDG